MKEIILLSGGIDSIALAYWRRPDLALTVDYGQRASRKEIESARHVAQQLGLEHHIVRADLAAIGCGSMLGEASPANAPSPEWWPFRNQMLLTLGAMLAAKAGARTVLIGTVAGDSVHCDGRAMFVDRFRDILACQEGDVTVEAPASRLSSIELVRCSGIPLSLLACAHSCHKGDIPCGQCRGCFKHEEVFAGVGLM